MSPTLFLTCFAIYVAAITLFGMWITRKQQSGEEFLLGGRRLPFLLTLGTTVATIVGTGSSMGAVGKAYQAGWMGSLFGLGAFLGVALTAYLFAGARDLRVMTMAEELSSYVGGSRVVSSIVAVFTYLACVGWLGAHILGGGRYLQYVTELHPTLALGLVAAGFAVYSTVGGYRAVVWTDTVQAIVLFVGFVLTAVFAWRSVGGWEGLQETQANMARLSAAAGEELPQGAAWLHGLSLTVAIAVGVLATPAFRQRIYSGNSVLEVQRAFYTSALLAIGFALLPSVIGMAAFRENPDLVTADLAFPYMATEMLPLALGVLTLLSGLSATMSSASSDAIAGVTILVGDLYRILCRKELAAAHVVRYSRWFLLLTTAAAFLLACSAENILGYIKEMIALFITGMCVCGVLGKVWPRYNAYGAIASLLSAFLTALVFQLIPSWTDYWGGSVIPTLGVSATLGILTAYLTKPDVNPQSE